MELPNGAARIAVLAAALAVSLSAAGLRGEGNAPSEYEMKAAFLYNFALFVEWPADSTATNAGDLPICVYGDDPFGGALEKTVAGRRIGERRVVARRVSRRESVAGCAIAFVTQRETAATGELLAMARGSSVLTVGESEGFVKGGGVVRFYFEANRIRFEINPEAANASGLRISSKLLGLARITTPAARGGRPK